MASSQDRLSGSGEAMSGNGRNSAPVRSLAGAFAGSAALRDAAQGVRQAFGAPTCRLGSAAAKASSCSQAAITRITVGMPGKGSFGSGRWPVWVGTATWRPELADVAKQLGGGVRSGFADGLDGSFLATAVARRGRSRTAGYGGR